MSRNESLFERRSYRRTRWLLAAWFVIVSSGAEASMSHASGGETRQGDSDRPILGSWEARSYDLASGPRHDVEGLIFFAEQDWMVLFFVMDEGEPKRGSAEGGRYELEGESLTFFHSYNFSHGEAMEGLEEQGLRMVVREISDAPDEPCRIELDGDSLTIRFPSGNSMSFRRSSR